METSLTCSQTEVIRRIAKKLAPKFTFGIHSVEDIEQEAFIMGLEALPYYDAERGNFSTFIYHHINNRLKNFKRDHYYREQFICYLCQGNDPECDNCLRRKWREENKLRLTECIPIEDVSPSYDDNPLDKIVSDEIFSIIDDNLPIELRGDYLRWKDGASLPHMRKQKVEQFLITILESFYD